MKKVITDRPESDVVHIGDVSKDKFYGIQSIREYKGFIIHDPDCQIYRTICSKKLFIGNGWPQFERSNLHDTIQECLSNPHIKIYEFDTHQELFAWLAAN